VVQTAKPLHQPVRAVVCMRRGRGPIAPRRPLTTVTYPSENRTQPTCGACVWREQRSSDRHEGEQELPHLPEKEEEEDVVVVVVMVVVVVVYEEEEEDIICERMGNNFDERGKYLFCERRPTPP
jgi:hypothetical protein